MSQIFVVNLSVLVYPFNFAQLFMWLCFCFCTAIEAESSDINSVRPPRILANEKTEA